MPRRQDDKRTNDRGGEDGEEGAFVNLPCPFGPSVPLFCIQSLHGSSLPVTLFVPMLTTLLATATLRTCTQITSLCGTK